MTLILLFYIFSILYI